MKVKFIRYKIFLVWLEQFHRMQDGRHPYSFLLRLYKIWRFPNLIFSLLSAYSFFLELICHIIIYWVLGTCQDIREYHFWIGAYETKSILVNLSTLQQDLWQAVGCWPVGSFVYFCLIIFSLYFKRDTSPRDRSHCSWAFKNGIWGL